MCEPTHSIIQIPLKVFTLKDGILEQDSVLLSAQFCLGETKRQLLAWSHQTRDYLHLSRLGQGHSESIQLTTNNVHLFPDHVKYEGLWWERKTRLDQAPHGGWIQEFLEDATKAPVMTKLLATELGKELQESSLTAASKYAERQSYGSILVLQSFLVESLRRTERPYLYVNEIKYKLLSHDGAIEFQRFLSKLDPRSWFDPTKQAIKNRKRYQDIVNSSADARLAALLEGVLHITSQRKNMNSAWADDKELWLSNDTAKPTEYLSTHHDSWESEGAEGWDVIHSMQRQVRV
jgi:hypothetical protein